MFDTGGLTQSLQDLNVKPEHIKNVHDALEALAESLKRTPFVAQPVDPVFGGSDKADGLTLHHARAREVIEDTIRGVIVDLHRYAAGVKQAGVLVDDADLTNAQKLQAKRGAVELVVASTSHSEGDRRNDESRNDPAGDS